MYETQKLNSVAECATLLEMALSEQEKLSFRKTSILRRNAMYASNEVEIDADIAEAQAELDGVNASIAVLPEGKKKEDAIQDKDRLEYRLRVLIYRKKGVGGVAVLDNALEVTRINSSLNDLATFIAEVEARKAEL